MNTIKLIPDAAGIIKLGQSIQGRSRKLDADIQQWAVSTIARINEHGDITPLTAMFNGKLGAGIRHNALKEYIETFAKVQYSEKSKAFMFDKTANHDTAAAMLKHWTEFKPEPEYKALNDVAMLRDLIKRMNKRDESRGDSVSDAAILGLEALVSELNDHLPADDSDKASGKLETLA